MRCDLAQNFRAIKSPFAKLSIRSLVLYAFVWVAVSFVIMFANYDSQQPVLPQWLSTMLAVARAQRAATQSII